MSLESVINSYEHPAALSNGWKIAINHVELILEFRTNDKMWHNSQGLPHMGNAAFHMSVEFPQLSKIPPQEKIHGPLVPPLQPLGSGW